ncbi:hypothetical protein BH10CHL1_BH10CHL1_28510 [soil metagenome]
MTHQGKLTIVSLGPGELDYLAPAARLALQAADLVVGYRFYVSLIRDLLTPQQQIVDSELGEEMARANLAIDLAMQGQRVALISSGDAGVYAMAGPVFEALATRGWTTGCVPTIEVIPGISALQAASARLGALIAHDFCTISLSDLHTEWSIIVQRVEAAAIGDFVIGFYNPRSAGRHWQLAEARRILLTQRRATTPVAIARHVMRPAEQITLTTLGELDVEQVDMMTLVIVGNSQTVRLGEHLATPRGYTAKKLQSATQ